MKLSRTRWASLAGAAIAVALTIALTIAFQHQASSDLGPTAATFHGIWSLLAAGILAFGTGSAVTAATAPGAWSWRFYMGMFTCLAAYWLVLVPVAFVIAAAHGKFPSGWDVLVGPLLYGFVLLWPSLFGAAAGAALGALGNGLRRHDSPSVG